MGESLRIPFLAAVGAPFWGLRQARLLAGLPDLVRKVQGPEYAKWNGLRAEEASLWLCLAANRLLLRNAWSEGGTPLWGCGAYALAAVLVQGFAAGGVGFPLAGDPSRLPDLPGAPPVEVLLPDAKTLELARIGLSPLTAARGETTAHFPSLPTLHAPKRYDKEEATRSAAIVATLPYQAFGGAAAHALQSLARATGGGLEPEEVRRRFSDGLLAFLAGAEEAPAAEEVEVEVQPSAGDPGIWEVLARLRPKFQIYGGDVDLVLGSVVPR
jgi:type VI secretion system protein ImpC